MDDVDIRFALTVENGFGDIFDDVVDDTNLKQYLIDPKESVAYRFDLPDVYPVEDEEDVQFSDEAEEEDLAPPIVSEQKRIKYGAFPTDQEIEDLNKELETLIKKRETKAWRNRDEADKVDDRISAIRYQLKKVRRTSQQPPAPPPLPKKKKEPLEPPAPSLPKKKKEKKLTEAGQRRQKELTPEYIEELRKINEELTMDANKVTNRVTRDGIFKQIRLNQLKMSRIQQILKTMK